MSEGFFFLVAVWYKVIHTGRRWLTTLNTALITGNNMRIKVSAGMAVAALLLAGCSTSNDLSTAGQNVRFVEEKPASNCQLLGTATGEQSNWLSGQHGEEGGSMRGAANALRNNAAAMGGNVLYGVSSPTQNLLSSFAPTASQMTGQVYKCPN